MTDCDCPIDFPHGGKIADGIISLSGLLKEKRFEEVSVTLNIDDLIRFFSAALEDVLQAEAILLLNDGVETEEEDRVEKVNMDHRLERIIKILSLAGISEKVLCQIVWHKSKEMGEEVVKINEMVGEEEEGDSEEF